MLIYNQEKDKIKQYEEAYKETKDHKIALGIKNYEKKIKKLKEKLNI